MPLPPQRSHGPAPARVAGSVRRTSSIGATWPEGRDGSIRFVGRARDLLTPRDGAAPVVLAEDGFEAILRPDRTIEHIATDPPRPALAGLVGVRGGGGFRKALAQALPEERRRASPLYLILDDLAPASLVATVAWSQWDRDWLQNARAGLDAQIDAMLEARKGVCIGHAPGSSAQEIDTATTDYGVATAAEPADPGDPIGWHVLEPQDGVGMRRARRIDVSVGEAILIDSEFQDSAARPGGGRGGVHEYGLKVTADPRTLEVLSIAAEPRVLPYPECPAATHNLTRLLGVRLTDLRERVLAELRGVAGCTHLNDALRALAEVPALAAQIR